MVNIDKSHSCVDTIEGKNLKDWTLAWWNWYLGIDAKEHPANPYSDYPGIHKNDVHQGAVPRTWPRETEKKVWFLAGSYGESTTLKTFVEPGEWHILASPYNIIMSKEEFPHMDSLQLYKKAIEDVDSAYEVTATLDGFMLPLIRVTPQISGTLKRIDNISEDNIFDIKSDSVSSVTDGYWVFLNPLPPGDHILHLKGYSKVYRLDVTYSIMVAGGGGGRPTHDDPPVQGVGIHRRQRTNQRRRKGRST